MGQVSVEYFQFVEVSKINNKPVVVKMPASTNIAGSFLKEKKLISNKIPGIRIKRGQKLEKLKKSISYIWSAKSIEPRKINKIPKNELFFFIYLPSLYYYS